MTIWDTIQDIVILFESDRAEGNTDIQEIILQLRAEGKHVAAWGYVSKQTIYTAAGSIFRILGKDDITCTRKVKQAPLQVWQSLPCDLLLDLTLNDCRPLQHLVAHSQAGLKTGKQRKGHTYQFMIQIGSQESGTKNQDSLRTTLCEQIVHYLKTIQAN